MRDCIIESLKKQFPVGSRVELIKMDDKQAPPIGTRGTVKGVDDIGSIMVAWDNGSSLNVIYGEDECRVLDVVKTICYGKERLWDKKEEAIEFFIDCMLNSEGSEKERYCNILSSLKANLKVCKDV
jgi:hypothetical protein|nr:MAG TPA: protein of unknown function (DUF4314) [Caudoviricetes sp.]